MKLSVGLLENRPFIDVEFLGTFRDAASGTHGPGIERFTSEAVLVPTDPGSSFALEVTIGIGFHWERNERQVFRGDLRIIERNAVLTAVNDVSLEDYVTSVISSEMSASCPIELLKAHAVVSRSWLCFPKLNPETVGSGNFSMRKGDEIIRWYGREAHDLFDVCADDHCQRYQGITKVYAAEVAEAVEATAHEMLWYRRKVCDARFSKCCGGRTEEYRTAWDDRDVPYLVSFADVDENGQIYCNTREPALISRILPGFDQETQDFFRWTVRYSAEEVRDLILNRLGEDVGQVRDLESLERGPSGRIVRLKIVGDQKTLIVGKELEIRRVLSRSHLYSSAFEVERDEGDFVLRGKGWGHGVGLCQIGAAVMASRGKSYREILRHYYPGTEVGV